MVTEIRIHPFTSFTDPTPSEAVSSALDLISYFVSFVSTFVVRNKSNGVTVTCRLYLGMRRISAPSLSSKESSSCGKDLIFSQSSTVIPPLRSVFTTLSSHRSIVQKVNGKKHQYCVHTVARLQQPSVPTHFRGFPRFLFLPLPPVHRHEEANCENHQWHTLNPRVLVRKASDWCGLQLF